VTSPTAASGSGAYQPWEGDYTDLVHVLWAAQREGELPREVDCDKLAGRIFRSRWYEATCVRAVHAAAAATPRPAVSS